MDNIEERDDIVTLVDEETGEELEFALVDGFDYKDKSYAVLITLTEKEEDAEMVILEEIETEGSDELMLQSLDEAVEDEIYDYYDQLCDESLDNED